MALAGHISDFPLAELLFFLSSKQRSGQLVLKRPSVTITFALRQGRLIAGQMTPGDQRLGERLVADGAISRAALEIALDTQERGGFRTPLGAVLVQLGFIDAERVVEAVRKQVGDFLVQFLLAPGGTFVFRERDALVSGVDVDLVIEREVLEAIRRADEWVAGLIDRNPLQIRDGVSDALLETVQRESWAVLDAMLAGATTVGDIVATTAWEREQVIGTLVQLQAVGVIEVEQTSAAARVSVA